MTITTHQQCSSFWLSSKCRNLLFLSPCLVEITPHFVFFVFFSLFLFGNFQANNHSAVLRTWHIYKYNFFSSPFRQLASILTAQHVLAHRGKASDKTGWHFRHATSTKEQYSIFSIALSCVMMTRCCHPYVLMLYCKVQMAFVCLFVVVFLITNSSFIPLLNRAATSWRWTRAWRVTGAASFL